MSLSAGRRRNSSIACYLQLAILSIGWRGEPPFVLLFTIPSWSLLALATTTTRTETATTTRIASSPGWSKSFFHDSNHYSRLLRRRDSTPLSFSLAPPLLLVPAILPVEAHHDRRFLLEGELSDIPTDTPQTDGPTSPPSPPPPPLTNNESSSSSSDSMVSIAAAKAMYIILYTIFGVVCIALGCMLKRYISERNLQRRMLAEAVHATADLALDTEISDQYDDDDYDDHDDARGDIEVVGGAAGIGGGGMKESSSIIGAGVGSGSSVKQKAGATYAGIVTDDIDENEII